MQNYKYVFTTLKSMGRRNCDNCGKVIEKESEHSLKMPDEYCEHCKSERYAEYYFCSKDCVKDWLGKN